MARSRRRYRRRVTAPVHRRSPRRFHRRPQGFQVPDGRAGIPAAAGQLDLAGVGCRKKIARSHHYKPVFATIAPAMLRTRLYADPANRFLHDIILDSCRRFPEKTAIVDSSCGRRLTYAEYGDLIESLAHGLIAAGLKPGELVAIFLANSWEFCAAYHAITLAGAVPTLLNPTYRERE